MNPESGVRNSQALENDARQARPIRGQHCTATSRGPKPSLVPPSIGGSILALIDALELSRHFLILSDIAYVNHRQP